MDEEIQPQLLTQYVRREMLNTIDQILNDQNQFSQSESFDRSRLHLVIDRWFQELKRIMSDPTWTNFILPVLNRLKLTYDAECQLLVESVVSDSVNKVNWFAIFLALLMQVLENETTHNFLIQTLTDHGPNYCKYAHEDDRTCIVLFTLFVEYTHQLLTTQSRVRLHGLIVPKHNESVSDLYKSISLTYFKDLMTNIQECVNLQQKVELLKGKLNQIEKEEKKFLKKIKELQ